jgi:uncharacterized lipoprotein YbaY
MIEGIFDMSVLPYVAIRPIGRTEPGRSAGGLVDVAKMPRCGGAGKSVRRTAGLEGDRSSQGGRGRCILGARESRMHPSHTTSGTTLVVLIAIALVGAGCAGSPSTVSETGGSSLESADPAIVRGQIVLPEGATIPPGAVAIARLADVSRQDVPAEILSELVWSLEGGETLDFELEYDPSDIEDWRTYVVQVAIRVDGRLHMISTTAIPVISNERPHEVEVPVERVG